MTQLDTSLPTHDLTVEEAAAMTLDAYVQEGATGFRYTQGFEDPGVMALAAVLSQAGSPVVRDSVGSAARLWLSRSETDQAFHAGLHGRGFGGCVVGLSAAAEVWPSCRNSARLSRIALSRVSTHAHWRPDNLGWPDFDLTTGPSGTLLSLLAGPAEPEADVSGVIEYLTGLCAEDDLRGLRVQQYQGDKLRAFNHGRVNSGPAHGAPGVALALVAAADAGLLPDTGYDVLRRIGDWLNTQSVVDSSGLRTWLPAGRHPDELVAGAGRTPHRSRRQGWCYGTPGVSWALWEIARVLDDAVLRRTAIGAATSFLTVYADDRYLDDVHPDRIGMCHGAAGTMMVFDAFHRYAELPGALGLRDHLADVLDSRLDEIVDATDGDTTLFSGSAGALTALLTVRHDTGRLWLRAFGLR